jgi:hypothetical protein
MFMQQSSRLLAVFVAKIVAVRYHGRIAYTSGSQTCRDLSHDMGEEPAAVDEDVQRNKILRFGQELWHRPHGGGILTAANEWWERKRAEIDGQVVKPGSDQAVMSLVQAWAEAAGSQADTLANLADLTAAFGNGTLEPSAAAGGEGDPGARRSGTAGESSGSDPRRPGAPAEKTVGKLVDVWVSNGAGETD